MKTSNVMTVRQAKKYIKQYCEHNSEVSSWAVEGVISSEEALKLTDPETIIDLAEDLKYQFQEEFGYLFN